MNLFRNINWYKALFILLVILLAGAFSCKRSSATLVKISTDLGDMLVEIYSDMAPVTAANFLDHVEKGSYTNSCFYRVVRVDN